MRSAQTVKAKTKKYIYTEEDLGEGLLEEGVTNPYFLDCTNSGNNDLLFNNDLKDSTLSKEVPNVQEDFTYAYYC